VTRFESLEAAAAWLETLINVEREPGHPYRRLSLEPATQLLGRLGHPERGLSVIHVAGSKGKGSTALFAESVLLAAGERVGTFTSPHLESWTERFRIDGAAVPASDLTRAFDAVRPHVEALRADPDAPDPSFFDATTAAALLLFREAGVDRVILEVGLGGRLDSTNVVDPAVTCITTLELEHTDKLGSTLAAIAGEKAGIVKPGRPVVTGRLPAEAAEVVAARAAEVGAPVAILGRDFDVALQADPTLLGVRLRVRDGDLDVEATLTVAGRHQAENAALALACIHRLGTYAPAALAAAARRGLPRAALPGRIEVLGERPWLVVDAAHTERSAAALAATLAPLPRAKTRLVLSISADKRLEEILARLLPLADEVFVTRADPIRSLDPAQVARAVRAAAPGLPLHAVPNPFLAVRAACEGLGADDLLLVTGSVYLAGIARRILRERTPE
jgi:dihydrofolate synthase/folylpolyglutamate synthase